jgi:hypothetical protein
MLTTDERTTLQKELWSLCHYTPLHLADSIIERGAEIIKLLIDDEILNEIHNMACQKLGISES